VSTGPACFDVETADFSCKLFTTLYGICSHTSGIGAVIAYQRCPNACNLCGGNHLNLIFVSSDIKL